MLTSRFEEFLRNFNWNQHVHSFQPRRALPPDEPKVWHRAAETEIKSDRHFWATLNYVLHNAVPHGYVKRWQEWPYTNASQYMAEVGSEEAERRWREYPVLDYGKDWDPQNL